MGSKNGTEEDSLNRDEQSEDRDDMDTSLNRDPL